MSAEKKDHDANAAEPDKKRTREAWRQYLEAENNALLKFAKPFVQEAIEKHGGILRDQPHNQGR